MMKKLQFLTLNTDHSQMIPRRFVSKDTMADLSRLIKRRSGKMYKFDIITTPITDGFAVFTVTAAGHPISQGTVCWNLSDTATAFDRAMESWAVFNSVAFGESRAPTRQRPNNSLWMCVTVFEPLIGMLIVQGILTPQDIGVLGTLHSCLGWALISAHSHRR